MQGSGKYILTIGGYDPSNGAGITQDVKTLERLGKPAVSVLTCVTVQNDAEVRSVEWLAQDTIHRQVDVLLDRYRVSWVKVSLVRDLASLRSLLRHLKLRLPEVRVVWDPVQVSGSGYRFNTQDSYVLLVDVLRDCYLVLPNVMEWNSWTNAGAGSGKTQLREIVNICITGGHRPDDPGTDILFQTGGSRTEIPAERLVENEKHGSGCVFASAVTAALSEGRRLVEAIGIAKTYVAGFIDSAPGPLGIHTAPASESPDQQIETQADAAVH